MGGIHPAMARQHCQSWACRGRAGEEGPLPVAREEEKGPGGEATTTAATGCRPSNLTF